MTPTPAKITHLEAARVAARWLSIVCNMDIVGYEVQSPLKSSVFDAIGVRVPRDDLQALQHETLAKLQQWCAEDKDPLPAGTIAPGFTTRKAKIMVVECKVSVADLRRDLKQKKMIRYGIHASHCVLMVSETIKDSKAIGGDLLAWLHARELPRQWGVSWIKKEGGKTTVEVLRRPKPLFKVEDHHARALALMIGKANTTRFH